MHAPGDRSIGLQVKLDVRVKKMPQNCEIDKNVTGLAAVNHKISRGWSGQRESNPHEKLGKLSGYHYIMPALDKAISDNQRFAKRVLCPSRRRFPAPQNEEVGIMLRSMERVAGNEPSTAADQKAKTAGMKRQCNAQRAIPAKSLKKWSG
jgi:hypothetical protein